MKVEFYEKEVTGKVKKAIKLHIKKTIQGAVKVVQPEEVVIRTATAQDKTEFKAEFEAFLASKEPEVAAEDVSEATVKPETVTEEAPKEVVKPKTK